MPNIINCKFAALRLRIKAIPISLFSCNTRFYPIEHMSKILPCNLKFLHICNEDWDYKNRETGRKQGSDNESSCVVLENGSIWKSEATKHKESGNRENACEVFREISRRKYDQICEREDACQEFNSNPQRKLDQICKRDCAHELFDKIRQRSLAASNLKISRFAQSGNIEAARELFDKMPQRNIVSWNSMIAGYGQNRRVDDARKMFVEMPQRNVVSWNAMIAGCLQNGNVDEGMELFDAMPERNSVTLITIIAGLVQNGKLEDARGVFNRMPERHVRSWNAMIAGYAQSERGREAVELFREMLRYGTMPNFFTFPSVVRACGSVVAVELGKQIHACVVKVGSGLDVFVGSALVTMYAKFGIIDHASKVMDEMPKKDLALGNAMIAGNECHKTTKASNRLQLIYNTEVLCARGCWNIPAEASKHDIFTLLEHEVELLSLSNVMTTQYFPKNADKQGWEIVPKGAASLLVQPFNSRTTSNDNVMRSEGFILLLSTMPQAYGEKERAWIGAFAKKFENIKLMLKD